MSVTAREICVRCLDEHGRLAGVLRLVQADRKADSIRILSKEEARQHGEEEAQLLEGGMYDFELRQARGRLREQANAIVKPSAIRPEIGRIETGVETGLLRLILEDEQTGLEAASGAVEVLSSKINYREDYRGMLTLSRMNAAGCSSTFGPTRGCGSRRSSRRNLRISNGNSSSWARS